MIGAARSLGRFDVIVANPPYIATTALAELPPEVGDTIPLLRLTGAKMGYAPIAGLPRDISDLMAASGASRSWRVGTGQASAVAVYPQLPSGYLFKQSSEILRAITLSHSAPAPS